MKRLLIIICLLIPSLLKAQNTVTLESGTSPLSTFQFRYKAVTPDSLNHWWLYNSLTAKYNRIFTATEIGKLLNATPDAFNSKLLVRNLRGDLAPVAGINFQGGSTNLLNFTSTKAEFDADANFLGTVHMPNLVSGTATSNVGVDALGKLILTSGGGGGLDSMHFIRTQGTSKLFGDTFVDIQDSKTFNVTDYDALFQNVYRSYPYIGIIGSTLSLNYNTYSASYPGGYKFTSRLDLQDNDAELTAYNNQSGKGRGLQLLPDSTNIFFDGYGKGLQYSADYSAGYTSRSLVDKAYVLAQVASGGGTTTNPITFNNGGAGASSGTTFNGSAARTISYNTIGAQAALGFTPENVANKATTFGTLNNTLYPTTQAVANYVTANIPTLQSVATVGNSYTGHILAQAYEATGTAGAGYYDLLTQSAKPTGVTGHLKIYRDSVGSFSYMNGIYRRTFKVPRVTDQTISYPFRFNPTLADSTDVATALAGKQATLVSGTNIKTVNGNSLPGSGNVSVGDALVANPLSQFAATSSAQLRTVLSDESGTGLAYFQGGDLGTPSAGVLTNATGTASGLTAGLVTSIGNLTGDVTSTNRATTYNNVVPSTKGGAGAVTGVLKANGSGVVSAATAGTDYLAPSALVPYQPFLQNNSTEIPFGDSHAAYGNDTGNPYFDSWGYTTQFNLFVGGKFYQPVNLGVAGNTTVQMLARLGVLLAYKPSLVLLNGGGNDIAVLGSSAAIVQTNILAMVNAIQSTGARIIIQTIPPRFSPNAFTAPQEVIRQAVNTYILTLASNTIGVVNWDTYVPTSGYYQSDGIHLNSQGAALIGQQNALAAATWVNTQNIASGITQDKALTTNVVLAGTSGSLNTATGQVATSWTGLGNNAGGATTAFSKTTTGGLNQQVITISGTTSGAHTRSYSGLFSNFATTSLNPGDITESILDFSFSGTLTNIAGFAISSTYNGSGGYISDSESYFPIDGLSSTLPAGRYQLRGYPFVVPTGVTNIDLIVQVFLTDGTSVPVSGVITINTAAIRKVDPAIANPLLATTGTGAYALAQSPVFVTPTLGAALITSVNGLAVTSQASHTLSIANGKTFTANNTLTFTGTDGTSFAFPGTSGTVGTLNTAQTWSAQQSGTTPTAGDNTTKFATTAYVDRPLVNNVLSKTASYTIVSGDFAVGKKTVLDLYVDATSAAVTITMPAASSFGGYEVFVTKTDASANVVTVNTVVGSNTLTTQNQSRQFNSNATSWYNH